MKRLLRFLSVLSCFFFSQIELPSQCVVDITCGGAYSNVVLGEISGDPGQSDGVNDAIVEIVGPPGALIGCMVLTDTEWAILIPPGTVIPVDGVYSFGCVNGPGVNASNTGGVGLGTAMSPSSPNGLVAGGNGDWNAGVPIDFDVCDPANASFYDPAASGFTLDNPGTQSTNGDGEQVFLFLPDGTAWDGIFWDGGGTGNSDHASVALYGNAYTLGDNDGNGVVNDVITTVPGGRGDGGNATAVPILPTDAGCPCNTPGSPGTFTVPAIPDLLWFEWNMSDHVGCNSSFIRLDPGTTAGGIGGSPSHMDGQVDDANVSTCNNNLNNGSGAGVAGDFGETTITSEGFTPTGFTPTACGDPTGQWAYTDHPTPGEPNDDPTWVFYVDNDILCAPGAVIFTAEIYNYQHVEEIAISLNQGNMKTGSYVFDPISGINEDWDTYVISGETTTMTYTTGVLPAGTHNFGLVWDDWTDCCGTSGNPHTQGNPNECYEEDVFTIKVVEAPMYDCDGDGITDAVQTPCVIDCGSPPPNPGAINANDYFVGGSGSYNFTLTDLSGTNAPQMNTTGVFQIPFDAVANVDYTITISDAATSCGFADLTITIMDNCELPPVCPENFVFSETTGGAGPINACPGDVLEFCFTGDDLPLGGAINIQADLDSDGIFETILCSEAVPDNPCASGGSGEILITELSDPQSGWQTNRFVEICNYGPCDQDLTGWTLEIIGNNSADRTAVLSGTLAVGQCAFIGNSNNTLTIDPTALTFFVGTTAISNFNGQSRDGAILFDNGTVVDVAVVNTADNNNWFENATIVRNISDCDATGPTIGTGSGSNLCGGTTSTCTGLADAWDLTEVAPTPGSHTVPTACSAGGPTNPEVCCIWTVPNDACPAGTFNFRAEVTPFAMGCPNPPPGATGTSGVDEPDAFSETIVVNVSCPEASITATTIAGCTTDFPDGVEFPVTITGGTGPTYTLEYAIDGVTQMPALTGFVSGDNINIPVPTPGKITVTLVSVVEVGCAGSVNDDEVCVDVSDPPTGTVIGATMSNTCDPCDGTVTFEFTNIPAAGLDFEYTIDGAGPFAGTTTVSPLVLMGMCPGLYELTSVEGDCLGTVSGSVTVAPPTSFPQLVINTQPNPVCDNGMFDVDLTMVDMTPTYNASTHTFYSADPNSVPEAQLPTIELPSSTVSGITMAQSVWVRFVDPLTGCSSSAEIMIAVNPALCAFDLALTKVVNTTASPGPFNPGDLVVYTICVFNQGLVTATDTEVTDYGATALTTPTLVLPLPTMSTQGTALTITDNGGAVFAISSLVSMEDVCVDIQWTIAAGTAPGTVITNNAEITADSGADGDSMPGNGDGTNAPPTPDPNDNDVNDVGGGDDYDPAEITLESCTEIIVVASPVCPAEGTTFNIDIASITGGISSSGNDFNVQTNGAAGPINVVYSGAPITIGPFNYNPAMNQNEQKVTITVTDADRNDCSTTYDVLPLYCAPQTTCDCVDFPEIMPLTINAQASGNGNGFSMFYVLVDGLTGLIVEVNETGEFGPLADKDYKDPACPEITYTVHAINIADDELADAVGDAGGFIGTPFDGAYFENNYCADASASAAIEDNCGCTVCPTIGTLSSMEADVCDGRGISLELTGFSDLKKFENGVRDYNMELVQFNGLTPPADPYAAPNASLFTINAVPLDPVTIPGQILPVGQYNLCVRLSDVSAPTDPACRPAECILVEVFAPPTIAPDADPQVCWDANDDDPDGMLLINGNAMTNSGSGTFNQHIWQIIDDGGSGLTTGANLVNATTGIVTLDVTTVNPTLVFGTFEVTLSYQVEDSNTCLSELVEFPVTVIIPQCGDMPWDGQPPVGNKGGNNGGK